VHNFSVDKVFKIGKGKTDRMYDISYS